MPLSNKIYPLRTASLLITACFILGFVSSCKQVDGPLHVDMPNLDKIDEDVKYLADDRLMGREIGTPGERMAGDYIADKFKEAGLQPGGEDNTYFQKVSVNKKQSNPHGVDFADSASVHTIEGRNVLGYLDVGASETIIIGGHYDHLGHGGEGSLHAGDPEIHNGADDNASGVAAIIEVARIFQKIKPAQNILFMAFTGEEKGLWGSNFYVKNPTIDLDKVNFMINLDMVGRLEDDRGLIINGVGTSPKWNETIDKSNTFGLKITTTESGVGPSDHTSFYLQDMPVIQFFTGAHEDYHKPSDDYEKINFEGIGKIVGLIANIVYAADDDKLAFVKTKDDEGPTAADFKVTLGVIPDYIFDGSGMRIDGVREERPAHNAGMIKGDIVVQMDTAKVTNMTTYMQALSLFEEGQTIEVLYIRDGESKKANVTF